MIKKVLVSLCVLPLLLTACSKNEVIAPVADSGKAISFGTVLAPANRGAVVDKTALQGTGNGFTVVAYDQGDVTSWNTFKTSIATVSPSGGNFMDNTKVTWNGTDAWTYSPVKFWPNLITDHSEYGHVTFFAYGGKASGDLAISLTTSEKYPKITYDTPAAADLQADLVADVLFDEQWSAGKQVKFQFEHILSRIGFKAKLAVDYADVEVKVTSLKVKYADGRVVKGADYHFNTDSDTPAGKGSWQTGTSTFTGGVDSGELIPGDAVDGVEVTSTSTAVQLNDITKYLMLIPQELVANGLMTVELEYKVTTDKGKANENTEIFPARCEIPAITYAMGTAYTYTFNIVVHAVVFDADIEVSGWDPAAPQPDDITIQ